MSDGVTETKWILTHVEGYGDPGRRVNHSSQSLRHWKMDEYGIKAWKLDHTYIEWVIAKSQGYLGEGKMRWKLGNRRY